MAFRSINRRTSDEDDTPLPPPPPPAEREVRTRVSRRHRRRGISFLGHSVVIYLLFSSASSLQGLHEIHRWRGRRMEDIPYTWEGRGKVPLPPLPAKLVARIEREGDRGRIEEKGGLSVGRSVGRWPHSLRRPPPPSTEAAADGDEEREEGELGKWRERGRGRGFCWRRRRWRLTPLLLLLSSSSALPVEERERGSSFSSSSSFLPMPLPRGKGKRRTECGRRRRRRSERVSEAARLSLHPSLLFCPCVSSLLAFPLLLSSAKVSLLLPPPFPLLLLFQPSFFFPPPSSASFLAVKRGGGTGDGGGGPRPIPSPPSRWLFWEGGKVNRTLERNSADRDRSGMFVLAHKICVHFYGIPGRRAESIYDYLPYGDFATVGGIIPRCKSSLSFLAS